jgi:hypothetical protein
MSLDVAQQDGTKDDGQNSKNKQLATRAIVFLFFMIFPLVVVFLQLFYFFRYFFDIFLQRAHTRWNHKKFQLKQR